MQFDARDNATKPESQTSYKIIILYISHKTWIYDDHDNTSQAIV